MPLAIVRSPTGADLWRSRWPWTLSKRRLMRHQSCPTPQRGPFATSPLHGGCDHFGVRSRSSWPKRCQARLIVTSLLSNFSAASCTTSWIRIFSSAARASCTRDQIQRAIARSSRICASLSMVGALPFPPSRPNAWPNGPPLLLYLDHAAASARIHIHGTGRLVVGAIVQSAAN